MSKKISNDMIVEELNRYCSGSIETERFEELFTADTINNIKAIMKQIKNEELNPSNSQKDEVHIEIEEDIFIVIRLDEHEGITSGIYDKTFSYDQPAFTIEGGPVIEWLTFKFESKMTALFFESADATRMSTFHRSSFIRTTAIN